MFHQQINQAQQTLNSISQHLRQAQQMCNECSRMLQNVTGSMQQADQARYQGYYQPSYGSGMGSNNMGFEAGSSFTGGRDFGPTMNFAQSTLSTQSSLIDPTTSNPSTYQNTIQQFSGQTQGTVGGYASTPNIGSVQNMAQGSLRTQSPLIDPTTMSPNTYESSLQQFSGGAMAGTKQSASVSSGAMTGAIGGTMATTMGGTMGGTTTGGISMSTPSLHTNETFASIATMSPDTYQASAQRLGGSAPDLRSIGQQAGISGSARGYSQ